MIAYTRLKKIQYYNQGESQVDHTDKAGEHSVPPRVYSTIRQGPSFSAISVPFRFASECQNKREREREEREREEREREREREREKRKKEEGYGTSILHHAITTWILGASCF